MSREVLDSRSYDDEMYDDRPERAPGRGSPLRIRIPRRWLTKLRSIAPLAIAFVLGLVLGSAGWNEWHAQREVAAVRSAVSFTAKMSSANATSSGIEAYVRLTNIGTETVVIDELEFTASAIQSSSRQDAEPIEALPDKNVTSRLFLLVDCTVRASVEATLSMRVHTVDGAARSATLPIEDDDGILDNAMYTLCPDPNDGFIPVNVAYNGASSVVVDSGPALRMPISLSTWTPLDVTVLSMRPSSNKLSVSIEGLPLELTHEEMGTTVLNATWRVLDCRYAGNLRYEALGFVIEAQRPGGVVITTSVMPDPNIALDLAKFVSDTCRTA
jgi:hypothetical protein